MHCYCFYLIAYTFYDAIFPALMGFAIKPTVMLPLSCIVVDGLLKYAGVAASYIGVCIGGFISVQMITIQIFGLLYRLNAIIGNARMKRYNQRFDHYIELHHWAGCHTHIS